MPFAAFVAGSNNLGQCGESQKEDKKEFYPILSNVGEIRQVHDCTNLHHKKLHFNILE